jgi:hypothetical protein
MSRFGSGLSSDRPSDAVNIRAGRIIGNSKDRQGVSQVRGSVVPMPAVAVKTSGCYVEQNGWVAAGAGRRQRWLLEEGLRRRSVQGGVEVSQMPT